MEDPTVPIPKLPNDVIIYILTWLPVKPLMKFKCVCKSWRVLISSQQFVKAHLKNLKSDPNLTYGIFIKERRGNLKQCSVNSVLYEPVSETSDLSFPFQSERNFWPEGECNGLILMNSDQRLCLWNPSTRTCKKLPGFCVKIEMTAHPAYGLGYHKSRDDYKVVGIFDNNRDMSEVIVLVYSLRNDRWKRIRNLNGRWLVGVMGAFANGKLYWIAHREYESVTGWDILSLDLEKEEEDYEILRMPSYVKIGDNEYLQMCEGSVYLISTHRTGADVWIMDGCSVGIVKWTKVITIPCIDHHWMETGTWLLHVPKNGLVLFRYGRSFVVY